MGGGGGGRGGGNQEGLSRKAFELWSRLLRATALRSFLVLLACWVPGTRSAFLFYFLLFLFLFWCAFALVLLSRQFFFLLFPSATTDFWWLSGPAVGSLSVLRRLPRWVQYV